jgi:hypothetical protein
MNRPRALTAVLAAFALALSLSACGLTGGFGNEGPEHGTLDSISGPYINFRNDLTYQVEISRFLNPYDIEDQAYLRGIPAGTPPLGPKEQWFAIFIRIQNETKQSHLSASQFKMIDTEGNSYSPIPLNPGVNDFAYAPGVVQPKAVVPTPSSIAAQGDIVGVELLFRVPPSFFYNRPVTLEITSPIAPVKTKMVDLDI